MSRCNIVFEDSEGVLLVQSLWRLPTRSRPNRTGFQDNESIFVDDGDAGEYLKDNNGVTYPSTSTLA